MDDSDLKLETTVSTAKEYSEYVRCFKDYMDSDFCQFCTHHYVSHIGTTKQPHFFKHVEEYDDRKFLHKRKEDGIYLTKMVVDDYDVLKNLFCEQCAKELETEQVLCYRKRYGVGEIIGDVECISL